MPPDAVDNHALTARANASKDSSRRWPATAGDSAGGRCGVHGLRSAGRTAARRAVDGEGNCERRSLIDTPARPADRKSCWRRNERRRRWSLSPRRWVSAVFPPAWSRSRRDPVGARQGFDGRVPLDPGLRPRRPCPGLTNRSPSGCTARADPGVPPTSSSLWVSPTALPAKKRRNKPNGSTSGVPPTSSSLWVAPTAPQAKIARPVFDPEASDRGEPACPEPVEVVEGSEQTHLAIWET